MPWNGSDEAVVVVDEDDELIELLRVAFFCDPPLVFLVALPDLFAFLDLSFLLVLLGLVLTCFCLRSLCIRKDRISIPEWGFGLTASVSQRF